MKIREQGVECFIFAVIGTFIVFAVLEIVKTTGKNGRD